MIVLVCDIFGSADSIMNDVDLAFSPIQCLEMALVGNYKAILIRFSELKDRTLLLELCAALKRIRHTQRTPLVAILPNRHRRVLECLSESKADYVKIIEDFSHRPPEVKMVVGNLGPEDGVDFVLMEVCPYIHYIPIDPDHEMAACGAYRDRLVLVGTRLNGLCELIRHERCEYFVNQRTSYKGNL